MDYARALTDLASRFTVTTGIVGSPLEPELILQPPAELLATEGLALSFTELENILVGLPISIDLAFLGKWVRTLTPDLPADPALDDPFGGMPIVEQIVGPLGLTTNLPPNTLMNSDVGQEAVPGVPEVLGRIKGTITPTIERLKEVVKRLPVELSIEWRVIDDATGKPPTDVTWQVHPEGWEGYFPVIVGFSGMPLPLRLRFPAVFSELTTDVPEFIRVTVHVRIKLRVTVPVTGQVVETAWISLPPIPLLIPTIPVPTILVLCEHKDFGGRKLVLVPTNSLLGAATASGVPINTALQLTSSALQTLTTLTGLVGFLAGSVGGSAAVAAGVLQSLAAAQGQTIIFANSQVGDLTAQDYVFAEGGFLGIGRFTGDNMASSLICVGRPGVVVRLHHHPNFDMSITPLEITLDQQLGCAIRLLNELDPNTVYGHGPFSDSGPRIVYGGNITLVRPISGDHEDVISSVTLTGPTNRFVKVI